MAMKPDDAVVAASKRQLDVAMRMMELITDASKKVRKTQLKAATEAHASTEAVRKRLAEAGDAQELWRIQGEWMSASLQKSLAYWRELFATAVATQSSLAKCLFEQARVFEAQSPAPAGASEGTLLGMMDTAYKRWLESTRQFYAAPTDSPVQVREAA